MAGIFGNRSDNIVVCMDVSRDDLDMFHRINLLMQNEINRTDGNAIVATRFILWYKDFINEISKL